MNTNMKSQNIDEPRELQQQNWMPLCEQLVAICTEEPAAFAQLLERVETLSTRLDQMRERLEIAEQSFATLCETLLSLSKHRIQRTGDR